MNQTDQEPVAKGSPSQLTQEQIIEAIRTCYDPEIPVNIHEMGLIYGIKLEPSGAVEIQMTLTSPNCPSAASLPYEVECKVKALPGVSTVKVELVWDPIWNPSMMSEAARLQLGMFW
jgi:FeS assembly SUF system protein